MLYPDSPLVAITLRLIEISSGVLTLTGPGLPFTKKYAQHGNALAADSVACCLGDPPHDGRSNTQGDKRWPPFAAEGQSDPRQEKDWGEDHRSAAYRPHRPQSIDRPLTRSNLSLHTWPMPKRVSSSDVNLLARLIVERSTREKNPAAVALGLLGGRKGGLARAAKLSASRRSAIAKKAARARWGKRS